MVRIPWPDVQGQPSSLHGQLAGISSARFTTSCPGHAAVWLSLTSPGPVSTRCALQCGAKRGKADDCVFTRVDYLAHLGHGSHNPICPHWVALRLPRWWSGTAQQGRLLRHPYANTICSYPCHHISDACLLTFRLLACTYADASACMQGCPRISRTSPSLLKR